MQKTHWKDIVEVVGIAAIVASLIFVGFEMRQTRQLAMADAYQKRTELEMQLSLMTVEPDKLKSARAKAQSGQLFSAEEIADYEGYWNAQVMYWENVHYQWENGLLERDHWEAQLASIRLQFDQPASRLYWTNWRHVWREPFREVIDRLISEAETGAAE